MRRKPFSENRQRQQLRTIVKRMVGSVSFFFVFESSALPHGLMIIFFFASHWMSGKNRKLAAERLEFAEAFRRVPSHWRQALRPDHAHWRCSRLSEHLYCYLADGRRHDSRPLVVQSPFVRDSVEQGFPMGHWNGSLIRSVVYKHGGGSLSDTPSKPGYEFRVRRADHGKLREFFQQLQALLNQSPMNAPEADHDAHEAHQLEMQSMNDDGLLLTAPCFVDRAAAKCTVLGQAEPTMRDDHWPPEACTLNVPWLQCRSQTTWLCPHPILDQYGRRLSLADATELQSSCRLAHFFYVTADVGAHQHRYEMHWCGCIVETKARVLSRQIQLALGEQGLVQLKRLRRERKDPSGGGQRLALAHSPPPPSAGQPPVPTVVAADSSDGTTSTPSEHMMLSPMAPHAASDDTIPRPTMDSPHWMMPPTMPACPDSPSLSRLPPHHVVCPDRRLLCATAPPMSHMPRPRACKRWLLPTLPSDAMGCICHNLAASDIFTLRQTCQRLRVVCECWLQRTRALSQRVVQRLALLGLSQWPALLQQAGAVLSGSFVLYALNEPPSAGSWQPHDLDVYLMTELSASQWRDDDDDDDDTGSAHVHRAHRLKPLPYWRFLPEGCNSDGLPWADAPPGQEPGAESPAVLIHRRAWHKYKMMSTQTVRMHVDTVRMHRVSIDFIVMGVRQANDKADSMDIEANEVSPTKHIPADDAPPCGGQETARLDRSPTPVHAVLSTLVEQTFDLDILKNTYDGQRVRIMNLPALTARHSESLRDHPLAWDKCLRRNFKYRSRGYTIEPFYVCEMRRALGEPRSFEQLACEWKLWKRQR